MIKTLYQSGWANGHNKQPLNSKRFFLLTIVCCELVEGGTGVPLTQGPWLFHLMSHHFLGPCPPRQ